MKAQWDDLIDFLASKIKTTLTWKLVPVELYVGYSITD